MNVSLAAGALRGGSRTRSSGAIRLLIGLLGLVLAALVARYGSVLFSGHRAIGETDLLNYYAGARLVLTGHGPSLYNLQAVGHLERSILATTHLPAGVLPYLGPPYLAVLLAPLTLLPYSLAYAAWLLVNVAILGLCLYLLQRHAALPLARAPLLWVAALGFIPVVLALAQGQVSFLILLFLVAGFLALREGQEGRGGIFLALALVKPPYVLPFLLVLLARRQWRALGFFTGTALCLALAPLPLLGASANGDYLHLLLAVTGAQGQGHLMTYAGVAVDPGSYDPHVNYSLAAFFQLLLRPPLSTAAFLLAAGLVLAGLASLARRCERIEVPFGAAVVAAVLVNPHVLAHDLVLLLIPVAVLLGARGASRSVPLLPLLVGYLAIDVAGAVASVTRLQIAVLAIAALGLWLGWTGVKPERDVALEVKKARARIA